MEMEVEVLWLVVFGSSDVVSWSMVYVCVLVLEEAETAIQEANGWSVGWKLRVKVEGW